MSTVATKKAKKPASNIKLQPLGDRVVVEREESEGRTAGGIVSARLGQRQAGPRHGGQRRRRPAAGRRHAATRCK